MIKDSDILREAKKHIKSCSGVCGAVNVAVEVLQDRDNSKSQNLQHQAKSLKRWVRSMLGGHSWLATWLLDHGHISKDDPAYGQKDFWAKMEVTRQAWLDWMIEQCEKVEQDEQNNTGNNVEG